MFVVPLVKAVQEQQQMIDDLQNEKISQQQKMNELQKSDSKKQQQIDELKARLDKLEKLLVKQ